MSETKSNDAEIRAAAAAVFNLIVVLIEVGTPIEGILSVAREARDSLQAEAA